MPPTLFDLHSGQLIARLVLWDVFCVYIDISKHNLSLFMGYQIVFLGICIALVSLFLVESTRHYYIVFYISIQFEITLFSYIM